MAARGIPIIHLLHIRGLALRHGLAWDPIPLPAPGTTQLRSGDPSRGWRVWSLTGGYVTILLLLAFSQIRARRVLQKWGAAAHRGVRLRSARRSRGTPCGTCRHEGRSAASARQGRTTKAMPKHR
jgi:hypothetical protein